MKFENEQSNWGINWKIYIHLNRRIIHYLEERATKEGKDFPSMEDIKNISETELLQSWLSIPSMKELMLFQQQIKN